MAYTATGSVDTVAIVGSGTIGASWAAWFLARGYQVRVTDTMAGRDAFVQHYIETAWPALTRLNIPGESELATALKRLSFHGILEDAVVGAQFVQENASEKLETKQSLLAQIDAALPADRIIASSTSGFGATALSQAMAHPQRLVIGHPFNPPHLIPLVEVVGGDNSDPAAVEWALDFYRQAGKHPILIRKEVPGHLANRLQAALWREAVHLVVDGVASVDDVDAAIAYGPGLRWAVMGPHLTFHLGGGEGGMRHFVDHLGPAVESWWSSLGSPHLTPDVKETLVAGVAQATNGRSLQDLAAERDRRLLDLLEALQSSRKPLSQ
jgi:3-hydroxyacyl-CoA dehydrogenase